MRATIEKDGTLTLSGIAVNSKPVPSQSGKTLIVATTNGNQPVQLNDQIAKVGINVFIPNPAFKANGNGAGK